MVLFRIPVVSRTFVLATAMLAASASAGPVISWIAPYRVDQTKAMLQRDFGGVGMKAPAAR